jgi:FkbM family methyltransferase
VVNGVALRVDPRSRRTFTRRYDPGVADYVCRYLREGMEVWNVGANVGVFALQLATWVGPRGRVVAFEPNPAAAGMLTRNVVLNRFEERVEVARVAIGSAPGTVEFFADGIDGMARAGAANPALRARKLLVDASTLDREAALRGRRPALVLMDIEGWEIAALQAARTLLPASRFVIELHPSAWAWSGHARRDLEGILREWRMRAVPLRGQEDPLAEHGQVALERE